MTMLLDGARLLMPRLHAGQRRVGRESKRFNTLCCGRRWGKTHYGVDRAGHAPKGILRGFPVGWFAPTYKYLADPWRQALEIYRPLIESHDKTERQIRFRNGALLDFWTLDDPDAGRGRKYGHVIVDEAAKVKRLLEAWNLSIRPTLADFKGGGDLLSTPKGRNDFATLFEKGVTIPERGIFAQPGWNSFQLPTSNNPFIDADEIAEARADSPELVFAQEWLAHFVDFGGTAVKREWLKWGDVLARWPVDMLRVGMGVDLAISLKEGAAFTAMVIVAIDPEGQVWVVHAERARLTFFQTMKRVVELASSFRLGEKLLKPQVTVIEQVQYQAAVVQELLRTTALNVVGMEAEKDKLTRFQPLQNRYEKGLVTHAWDLPAVFEGELLAFPEGETKDMVDALVYAHMGAAGYDLGQTAAGAGDRVETGSAAASVTQSESNWGSVRVTPNRDF